MTHLPPSTRQHAATGKVDDFTGGLSFAQLLGHLTHQHELYHRLLEQTRRMSEMLEADRSVELPGVMDARQQVVDELQRIDGQLQGYRVHWIEWFPQLQAQQRQQVTQLTTQLEQLKNQLRELDRQLTQRLQQHRDQLGRELGTLGRADRAVQSYRGQQPNYRSATMHQTDHQG